jgi:hypothetical protein
LSCAHAHPSLPPCLPPCTCVRSQESTGPAKSSPWELASTRPPRGGVDANWRAHRAGEAWAGRRRGAVTLARRLSCPTTAPNTLRIFWVPFCVPAARSLALSLPFLPPQAPTLPPLLALFRYHNRERNIKSNSRGATNLAVPPSETRSRHQSRVGGRHRRRRSSVGSVRAAGPRRRRGPGSLLWRPAWRPAWHCSSLSPSLCRSSSTQRSPRARRARVEV